MVKYYPFLKNYSLKVMQSDIYRMILCEKKVTQLKN